MTGLEINRELHGGDVQDFPAARACTLEVTSFNIQSWVNINTCTCKQTNRPQKNKIEGYSTNVCSLPAGPGGPGMPSLPSRPKRNSMQSIYNSRLRAVFFFFSTVSHAREREKRGRQPEKKKELINTMERMHSRVQQPCKFI